MATNIDFIVKNGLKAGANTSVTFDSAAPANSLVLDSTGRVGLGVTPSGSFKLQIAGTLGATGNITANPAAGNAAINSTSPSGSSDAYLVATTAGQQSWSFGVNRASAGDLVISAASDKSLPRLTIPVSGSATFATGLAVTGTLSATGTINLQQGSQLVLNNTAGGNNYISADASPGPTRMGVAGDERLVLSSTGLAVTGTLTVSGASGGPSGVASSKTTSWVSSTIPLISLTNSANTTGRRNWDMRSLSDSLQFHTAADDYATSAVRLTIDASTVSAISFTGALNGNASTATRVLSPDTRAVVTTPETLAVPGAIFDFKDNAASGLSDGGLYTGLMTYRPYGSTTDWTGGPSYQLGFTANNNLWIRNGTNTTWGAWSKFYDNTDASSANTASTLVLRDASGNFSAGTITAALFTGPVTALKSATTSVSVSAATTPTTGQVLTATSGTAATWQTPGASSAPNTEIVYGTGASITSDPDFTFNSATDTLRIGSTGSALVKSFTGQSLQLASNNGAYGITIGTLGDLAINGLVGPAGHVLTSQGSGSPAVWAVAAANGGALSAITAATTSATINNANNPIRWNWTQTTASQTGFFIGENTASTNGAGAQYLQTIATLATSTANPLRVQTRGVDTLNITNTGAVAITALNGTAGSGAGGSAVTIIGGASVADNQGGAVSLIGGAGAATGFSPGGDINLTSGAGGTANGFSGNINIITGNSPALTSGQVVISSGTSGSAASSTGAVYLITGNAANTQSSGSVNIYAGTTNSGGGLININGADAGAVASVSGGQVSIRGGNGSTTTSGGTGGAVIIQAGTGGLALAGGDLNLRAGTGGATGVGGAIVFSTAITTSQTEKMRLDRSGNLCVNTTSSPNGSKIYVVGGITQKNVTDGSDGIFQSNVAGTVFNQMYVNTTDVMYESVGALPMTVGTSSAQTLRFKTSNTTRLTISSVGDVGIGNTPSGTYKLEVTGAVGATSFNATSTERVKDAIVDLSSSYLAKFAYLRPREYDRKDYSAHEFGFIAEEMAMVYPEVVAKDGNGKPASIDYGKLSTILTAKIQEQQTVIEQLQRQMAKVMELLKGSI